MLRNLLIVLAVFAVLGGIVAFVANGITDVKIERFEITQLTGVSLESFTVSGNLYIDNPSRLPVPVENVKYELVLRDTNETISIGHIPSFRLNPGVNQVAFSHETKWKPSIGTLLRLGAQKNVYADIKGEVYIDVFGMTSYSVPFAQQIDLKSILTQQIAATTGVSEEIVEEASGLVSDLSELAQDLFS